jgi:hypothetical protein
LKRLITRIISGFYFSADENSALVQNEGGPCAVIAPLQAFILKQLLNESDISTWRNMKPEKCNELLIKAMTDILAQAVEPTNAKFSILLIDTPNSIFNGEVTNDRAPMDVDSVLHEITSLESTSMHLNKPVIASKVFHSRLRYLLIKLIDQ